ncbi:helix-turn-helix domain-containing protein [Nakamurella alba]|uniref:helix-turn-helix domain-containing protein n=1 Tax=Nakamurella alba TaxID=2665158 RepID=UPI002AC31399|nr:MerR family transcriptional regulator [Nakamurella alba]
MIGNEHLLTIGQLARRSGVPVRTIRFWSDEGILPESGRTAAGYRCYDAAAVARLDLVRTLRDLGLGLDDVRTVLARRVGIAEVAATHVRAIDEQIRALRVQRAVCTLIARSGGGDLDGLSERELTLMNDLARMTAPERQRLLDDFAATAFAGIPDDAPGAGLGRLMRALPPELPDEPTTEQVEAWVELAGLAADPAFAARVREMAMAGSQRTPEQQAMDPTLVLEHAGAAERAGIDPTGPEGQLVLSRIVGDLPAEQAHELGRTIRTFTDRRVERYWWLLRILQGQKPYPLGSAAFEWFADALAAR